MFDTDVGSHFVSQGGRLRWLAEKRTCYFYACVQHFTGGPVEIPSSMFTDSVERFYATEFTLVCDNREITSQTRNAAGK